MLWLFFWRLPKLGNEFKSIFACCQVSNVASGGSLWGGWRFYFVSRKLSSVKPFRNSQRQALICSLVLAWCPRTLAHGAPFPGFSCKSLTLLSLSRKIISPIHILSQNFRMSILWLPSLTYSRDSLKINDILSHAPVEKLKTLRIWNNFPTGWIPFFAAADDGQKNNPVYTKINLTLWHQAIPGQLSPHSSW